MGVSCRVPVKVEWEAMNLWNEQDQGTANCAGRRAGQSPLRTRTPINKMLSIYEGRNCIKYNIWASKF